MNKNLKNRIFNVTLIILAVFSITRFVVELFVNGSDNLKDIIFLEGHDRFMDFFNSIRDANTQGVYVDRKVIYPALANCIYFLFGLIIPSEYKNTSFDDRYKMLSSPFSIISLMIFFFLLIFLLFYLIIRFVKGRKIKFLLLTVILLSFPMLWAVERANMILLCIFSLLGYVLMKDSENKYIRELSYVMFGISFSLKLYPIIFLLIPIGEKKYKEAIKMFLYSLILFFVPFAFYGGINSIFVMLKNIFSFNDNASFPSFNEPFTIGIASFLNNIFHTSSFSLKGILFLQFVLYVLLCFTNADEYLKIYIGCSLLINLPSGSINYNSLFYMISLFMLFNKEDKNFFDYEFMVMNILIFLPIPAKLIINNNAYFMYYFMVPFATIMTSLYVIYITIKKYYIKIKTLKI